MRCANPYKIAQVIDLSAVRQHNAMMAEMSYLNNIKSDVIKGYKLNPKPIVFKASDVASPGMDGCTIYVNPFTARLEENEIAIYNLIYAYLIK